MSREHRALDQTLPRGSGDAAEQICRERIEMAHGMVLSLAARRAAGPDRLLGGENPR